jgi:hypothetical protein
MEPNIIIKKMPAMSDEVLDRTVKAFIYSWSAMIDWNKYSAIVLVDYGYVYFLLFNKNNELSGSYVGIERNDYWYISTNKAKSKEKIANILSLISSTDNKFDID